MILGICGPKGSGKSTLQEQLIKRNYLKEDFADPIKRMLYQLVTSQGCNLEIAYRMFWGDLKEQPSEYLEGQSSRWAMQSLGTEWGRELIGWDLWINVWKRRIKNFEPGTPICTADMRFLNEARAIRSFSGKLILVYRDGCDSGEHPSEREYLLIQHDIKIYNDSTPEHMLQQLEKYLEQTT